MPSRIGSNLSSLIRVAWSHICQPPTVEEVYEAISQLNDLLRSHSYYHETLPPLSRTSDGRPTNAEHLLISQPTSEIGEKSLSISQTIENDMQNLSISEPPTGIGAQSSQVMQSSDHCDLLRTPTTVPHAHMPTLLESVISSSSGQQILAALANDEAVWTAITNNSTFTQRFGLASLVEEESEHGYTVVYEDEPLHEQEINTTLHSESSFSRTLGSDSDTRNEGVRRTEDTPLLKAFKMFTRVMDSISSGVDILRRANRTASVPVMQPIPGEFFGTGTTTTLNRPQPNDNMQNPSISTHNNWRHPDSDTRNEGVRGTLHSDSDTRNEGVRGTEDTLLRKSFKMFTRVMGSVSAVVDSTRFILAPRRAPVPVMQPNPSEIIGTGTTPAAPNRPQPNDNMQHPSISTDNNWRHPNSYGSAAGPPGGPPAGPPGRPPAGPPGGPPSGTPVTEPTFSEILIAVTAVILFIILKRIAILFFR